MEAAKLSQLQELIAACATLPWRKSGYKRDSLSIVTSEKSGDVCDVWTSPNDANTHLIVASVNALPSLLAERETLREALAALLGRLESGDLVRNTKWDGEADWAIKQIPMLRDIARAQEVLAEVAGD